MNLKKSLDSLHYQEENHYSADMQSPAGVTTTQPTESFPNIWIVPTRRRRNMLFTVTEHAVESKLVVVIVIWTHLPLATNSIIEQRRQTPNWGRLWWRRLINTSPLDCAGANRSYSSRMCWVFWARRHKHPLERNEQIVTGVAGQELVLVCDLAIATALASLFGIVSLM